eukprot:5931868-Amphidinium_carterae.1
MSRSQFGHVIQRGLSDSTFESRLEETCKKKLMGVNKCLNIESAPVNETAAHLQALTQLPNP